MKDAKRRSQGSTEGGGTRTHGAESPIAAETVPAEHYARQVQSHGAEAERLGRQNSLLSYGRLVWALAIVALAWFTFGRHALSAWWFLLPCVGFGVTARLHSRVFAAAARSARATAWNLRGLARVEDRWAGLHPRSAPPEEAAEISGSLYAYDLDLFSAGGLFELLCTARTSLGETALAGWLLGPAAPPEVRERQAAVAELRSRSALRETLAAVPGPDLVRLDAAGLSAWGAATQPSLPEALAWVAPLLAALTAAAAVRWYLSGSPLLLLVMVAVNWAVTASVQSSVKPLFEAAQRAAEALGVIAELLASLEHEGFTTGRLAALHASLTTQHVTASAAIRRLARLSGAIEQRGNWLLRIVDLLVLYSVTLGLLVQRWRRIYGAHLGEWLNTLGEFEALLSLSTYHYEHPADPFPELSADEPVFTAELVGHPLLPQASCVRNSVTLDTNTRLLLISGSNMSGKSTLLRSVGTAAVMAMAGAPVRAQRLRLGPLSIAASIQVSDSLQSGHSRFYAEILRLRAVCDLARTHPPVLFLLDELLAGTNSHDRLAGANGVIRELLAAGALGLLSTHDLALTEVGSEKGELIRNAHLEDRVEDGRMLFDYQLREGVVTRSNGLALMRLIGLDV